MAHDHEVNLLTHAYFRDGTSMAAISAGDPAAQALALVAEFAADRCVAHDTFTGPRGEVTVSTVFLVLDAHMTSQEHVPVLFETMVFTDGTPGPAHRSTTRDAALAVHAAAVAQERARTEA